MADLDPTGVPVVMPATVARTGPTGLPTQALMNWEQATQSWFVNNAIDLQTKITTVSAVADGAAAAVVVETTARVSADSALASQITTVSANVSAVASSVVVEQTARVNGDNALASSITTVSAVANGGTASGQVYLQARSAPGGASAAYGFYLTASGAYAGMDVIAVGGGSAMGFSAGQFMFTDSGTAQQVLAYNGSAFVFQVPIIIRSGTSGARQEITASNTLIYDGAGTLRVAIGVGI